VAAYIFTAPTCKATIISLEPCALNAEFQLFILRFDKNFLTLWMPLKGGFEVKGGPKTLQIILIFILTRPQNIYTGLCNYI
jgi:hypothetical protein